ncbi:hypothetical protein BO78DRAFT_401969 [Aspergillus sclerotiicarbonarius CBS 121057]|uniref:Uncharacterized protein n=1 Tax=Aspergillus sclerotiicarbonarius (strain CBS 121057 / IBT 28362) TaxID=1448318 RepID=A0A319DSA5_ASPSB|nr:hypothetical protein BO78DRAFT_401969 [Aspergillus sclerotiicarbonarius CBS 121057]
MVTYTVLAKRTTDIPSHAKIVIQSVVCALLTFQRSRGNSDIKMWMQIFSAVRYLASNPKRYAFTIFSVVCFLHDDHLTFHAKHEGSRLMLLKCNMLFIFRLIMYSIYSAICL